MKFAGLMFSPIIVTSIFTNLNFQSVLRGLNDIAHIEVHLSSFLAGNYHRCSVFRSGLLIHNTATNESLQTAHTTYAGNERR